MTVDDLMRMTEDLEAFYEDFARYFGRKGNLAQAHLFARGQLGPIERKSLEPIADLEGTSPRNLQQFFTRSEWREGDARDSLQRRIAQRHGGADGIFLIDETSDAKKGENTAGVARQYCGESGKIDNCIVSVHLGYARDGQHYLLDGELFLPACWDIGKENEQRRDAAKIPDHVGHVAKTEMAIVQLRRALANGVPGRYVTADELYGGKPWWRREVDAMGLIYVVEVPRSIQGWLEQEDGEAARLDTLLATDRRLYAGRKKRFRTHETEKGSEVWECRQVTFVEQAKRSPTCEQQLLVAKNVRTGEVKYFLSNAPRSMTQGQLLRVAFSRWRIERCFQDCKSELGLNHAEIRSYRGLNRHLILTMINYCFLIEWLRKNKPGEKRSDALAMRRRGTSASEPEAGGDHDRATATALGEAFA